MLLCLVVIVGVGIDVGIGIGTYGVRLIIRCGYSARREESFCHRGSVVEETPRFVWVADDISSNDLNRAAQEQEDGS